VEKVAQNQEQRPRVPQVHFNTGHSANSDHQELSPEAALARAHRRHFRTGGPQHLNGSG